jgi:hypothetical protein
VAIEDFPVLLSLDLRKPLSPAQTIDIVQKAKATIESQIREIHKEIADAEGLSILREGDKEVLNEEGLPIKDIREDVVGEEVGRRAVLAEEESTRIYTMEEIDKMMDEAMAEEQAELAASKMTAVVNGQKDDEGQVTAVAGDGLEVGHVSGEELLAKLMDDSKQRYNPIDDTWVDEENEEDSDEDPQSEDDDEETAEEEEDQYGRTRGFLIPPHLSKEVNQTKAVKFASFEKPATPSTGADKPVKSALKKSNIPPPTNPSPSEPAVPIKSTRSEQVMVTSIVERVPKKEVTYFTSILMIGYPKGQYQGET